jgi:hypothetical protein
MPHARARARSDDGNTTDDDAQDRARLRSDDSTKRQKRDRGSPPGVAAQHKGAVHPLANTYHAESADAVARLSLTVVGWFAGPGLLLVLCYPGTPSQKKSCSHGWEQAAGGGAPGDAQQNQGTGNDNTKRGRGSPKKEKQLESYFPKKPREAADNGV